MLLDELRRILLIPGATEFVKELLAQMRKYRCVFIGAFQEPSQIDDIDPALTELLLGQCKQFFLMRQNNADPGGAPGPGDRPARRGAARDRPASAGRAPGRPPQGLILHVLLREDTAPLCGTVRVEVDPAMLYVTESSGAVFDSRMRALSRYPSVYDGVLAESGARTP